MVPSDARSLSLCSIVSTDLHVVVGRETNFLLPHAACPLQNYLLLLHFEKNTIEFLRDEDILQNAGSV